MDKHKTNNFLRQKGFDVPQNLLIQTKEFAKNKTAILTKIKSTLKLPVIIKPHDDGCSVLVQKITTDKGIESGLEKLFKSGKTHALIEV